MAKSLSQDVLSAHEMILTQHAIFGMLQGQNTRREMWERAMASRSSGVWQNSETYQFTRPFAGLAQICSSKTAPSLNCKAAVSYAAHVGESRCTRRRRSHRFNHGYTLLAFLRTGTAEVRVEIRDFNVDGRVSSYEFASSDLVHLENFLRPRFWTGAQNRAWHYSAKHHYLF